MISDVCEVLVTAREMVSYTVSAVCELRLLLHYFSHVFGTPNMCCSQTIFLIRYPKN